MEVKFNILDRLYQAHQKEYEEAALRVLRSGWYILGTEGDAFENEFKAFTGSQYCVGLNSGLDALILAVKALGIGAGDEVVLPANTYIATVMAITYNGAIPVFVEPDEFHNIDASKIQSAITPKTKAIVAVHLYGQAANMDDIMAIAKSNQLYVIEDCAQSHKACFNDKMTGTFGDIGCFSFFPTKNLGAFGDAGAIVTDNIELAEKIKKLRNYGSSKKYQFEYEGINSRLDEIQAALLRARLPFIDEIIDERIQISKKYLSGINNPNIRLPKTREGADHIYHLFVVEVDNRDEFQKYLLEYDISTQIHYPIPPHLSECYENLNYKAGDFPITEHYSNIVLSLPLFNGMTNEEIDYVIKKVNGFNNEYVQ